MNSDSAASFFCEPATICLADANLLDASPVESVHSSDEQDEKKQVKKRKSWGQELPVPKTNLPPRKRAKTDDEKEQRRIERVLRNRQAAQSSRERKRLEVERLEGERDIINQQNHLLKKRLLAVEEEKFKMKQELAEMRSQLKRQSRGELTPSATPSPKLSIETFNPEAVKGEFEELPSLFASSEPTSIDPKTPVLPATPQSAATISDLAQHPAAVLCNEDLQCQSELVSPSPREVSLETAETPSDPWRPLATLLLFQTIHLSVSSTTLSPLSRLLASLRKGSRLKTQTITPMLFTLITWLISTPRSRLMPIPPSASPSNSAATTATASSTPSTSSPSTTRSSTFRTSLLRRLLSCSPALARPLKDATARALREKASYALRGVSVNRCLSKGEVVESRTCFVGADGSSHASKAEVWRLMTMAVVIDQFIKDKDRKQQSQ